MCFDPAQGEAKKQPKVDETAARALEENQEGMKDVGQDMKAPRPPGRPSYMFLPGDAPAHVFKYCGRC